MCDITIINSKPHCNALRRRTTLPPPTISQPLQPLSHQPTPPHPRFRYSSRGYLNSALQTLASYIGAAAADVVFIENASQGVNTVLRSLKVLNPA